MKPDCTFDADTHRYTIDGRPVPSVTQVLADVLPGWKASEWHMQRGTAVHACAAMIARGVEFTFDNQIAGQVEACRKFVDEVIPKRSILEVERAVYSRRYQYAGRFDLLAGNQKGDCIYDFKASLTPSVPYQCAAYALAYGEEYNAACIPSFGMGVELREDGTYRLSEVYDLRRFKQGFLSLLTTYGIRRKCGIKQEWEDAG